MIPVSFDKSENCNDSTMSLVSFSKQLISFSIPLSVPSSSNTLTFRKKKDKFKSKFYTKLSESSIYV